MLSCLSITGDLDLLLAKVAWLLSPKSIIVAASSEVKIDAFCSGNGQTEPGRGVSPFPLRRSSADQGVATGSCELAPV